MKTAPQFETHPDAESLSAFLENALPEGERTQVMAHLAACGQCREVVFLARGAAEEIERPKLMTAAAAPVDQAAVSRHKGEKPRLSWWRFAWAPAAAAAMVALVAFWVYSTRAPQQLEMAQKNAPAPQIQAEPSAPAPKETMAAKPMSAFAGGAVSIEAKSAAVANRVAGHAPTAVAAPERKVETDALQAQVANQHAAEGNTRRQTSIAGRNAANLSGIGGPYAQNQAQNRFADQASIDQAQLANTPENYGKRPANAAPPSANAAPAAAPSPAPSPAAAAETVAVSAAAPPIQTEAPAVNVQLEEAVPAMKLRAVAKKKSGLPMLPSGLPVVSTAAAGRTTLALDAAGSLFVSHDPRGNWERAVSQWTGRAKTVRLAQPDANKTIPAAEAAKKAYVIMPLFELVTDANVVWTSADGKTWSPK